MQVLYKDEELMEICGPEEDIAVAIDAKSAEKAIRELYANGKADLSAYEYQDRDFDDEDDEDDLFDRMIDMDFRTLGKDGVIFRDDE